MSYKSCVQNMVFFSIAITASSTVFAFQKQDFLGSWAMEKLNNGIANVIVFDEKGVLTLYPYECLDNYQYKSNSLEYYNYKVKENSIFLEEDGQVLEEMNISELSSNHMIATEISVGLKFSYIKIIGNKPICE